MDEAVSILRKKGVATAAKKSGRSASEGVIAQSISSDRSKGILVEVNCELILSLKMKILSLSQLP